MAFEINFLGDNIAVVHGRCDGTKDTALDTLPPNPFQNANVFAWALGEGAYVEDDGSLAPRQSGVLAATIDIRSRVAAKFYLCVVIKLTSGEGMVRDHSAITT